MDSENTESTCIGWQVLAVILFVILLIVIVFCWVGSCVHADEVARLNERSDHLCDSLDNYEKLLPYVPQLQLDTKEKVELDNALKAKGLTGDPKPIHRWLDGLRKKGKSGYLPPLPYDVLRRPDILFVADGRAVLLPLPPPPNSK